MQRGSTVTEKVGMKGDSGKRRWRFFPWAELGEVSDVLDKGATRYAPDNWKSVDDAEGRYFDAAMRHLLDGYASGEYIDDPAKGGDGKSHLAHAICCLLFLMWFGNKNDKRSPFAAPLSTEQDEASDADVPGISLDAFEDFQSEIAHMSVEQLRNAKRILERPLIVVYYRGTQMNQAQCAVAASIIAEKLRNTNEEEVRERFDI